MSKDVVLLTGPTASGKTGLSIEIANLFNGVIINADSMQVYKEIPIISAQPSLEKKSLIDHQLYSIISGEVNFSVGMWLENVISSIRNAHLSGKLPIVTGGTGLYFKALVCGLSHIPQVSDEVRIYVNDLYDRIGQKEFFQLSTKRDHDSFIGVESLDKARMIRAFSVLEETGKSIKYWHDKNKMKRNDEFNYLQIYLDVPRKELYNNIDERFIQMVELGAIDEVEYLVNNIKNENLSIMKALGVGHIASYINGKISLKEAITCSKQDSRNYAKRQITWFKNQDLQVEKVTINPYLEKDKLLEYISKYLSL